MSPAPRVASVPAAHPYVRHLTREEPRPDDAVRLADADPDHPARTDRWVGPGERWWPAPPLGEAWWQAGPPADVLHVHFGFDDRDPAQLSRLLDRLDAVGVPLVQTVHDLRNPHHADPAAHEAHLGVLLPRAARVVTLTPGAAAEIHQRWGVTAQVVPHPHVVPLDTMAAWQATPREPGPFRVGVRVGALRANSAPELVLPALLDAVRALGDTVLQLDVAERTVRQESERAAAVAALVQRLAREPEVDLRLHPHLPDDDLFAVVQQLDVSVLAYRFGTHSGWLEMCADVGTDVVAPSCGHYADQGPVDLYRLDEADFDAASLLTAVRAARERGPRPARGVAERRRQRAEVAAAHERIYRTALGGYR